MEKRLLRTEDICRITGVSRQTIWRWYRKGKLPRPITIGSLNFWDVNTIEKWLEQIKGEQYAQG